MKGWRIFPAVLLSLAVPLCLATASPGQERPQRGGEKEGEAVERPRTLYELQEERTALGVRLQADRGCTRRAAKVLTYTFRDVAPGMNGSSSTRLGGGSLDGGSLEGFPYAGGEPCGPYTVKGGSTDVPGGTGTSVSSFTITGSFP